jgi:hypothetical protein
MKFSPSSLQDFQRCPRCFWLAKNKGIKQPRGIYPSIPGKLDELLKERYDAWRVRNDLPPELRGLVDGQLLYTPLENLARWRQWDSGLVARDPETGLEISGMVDDVFQAEDGMLSVLDYKTKGDAPWTDYSERYYTVAADCYDLMLGTVDETSHNAYFVYYFPSGVVDGEESPVPTVPMNVQVQMIEAKPERAIELARKAHQCLGGGLPAAAPGCEMCQFVDRRSAFTGYAPKPKKGAGKKHG